MFTKISLQQAITVVDQMQISFALHDRPKASRYHHATVIHLGRTTLPECTAR